MDTRGPDAPGNPVRDSEVPREVVESGAVEPESMEPESMEPESIGTGLGRFIVQWNPMALLWGMLLALRTIAVTVGVTALVIVPVVLVEADTAFSAKTIFESTTWAWLLVNGVPPRLGAATFTLVPWGLALLPWFLNFFAARRLASRYQDSRRFTVMAASSLCATYIASVVLAAAFVESINVSYSVWAALMVSIALSGTATIAGVISRAVSVADTPTIPRFILARAMAAAFALFGIGALTVAVLLVANFADVLYLFNQLNPGYSGFLAITFLSLGYLPVLAIWSVGYLVGAGFNIGPDVMVSPFIPVTAPTQLPPFPPLAVLPEQAGAVAWLLPALVIVLGVIWGIGISLRMSKESALTRIVIAVGVAVVAALIVMGLAALSIGSLGDVRLVDLGPSPTLVGSLTWLLLVIGMTPAAGIPARVFTRKRRAQIAVVPE